MKVYHLSSTTWRFGGKFAGFLRSNSGSQIVEFGASLSILTACILMPLLDFGIIPVRWMMARQVISDKLRELSFCETFSQALTKVGPTGTLVAELNGIGGVEIEHLALKLKISKVPRMAGDTIETITIASPNQIPREWLPDGSKAPCVYMIELDAGLKMSPALSFNAGPLAVPGLNAPVLLNLQGSREWEHSGLDPVTGKFFLNE